MLDVPIVNRDKDIVRTTWRHVERDRNITSPRPSRGCNNIVGLLSVAGVEC